MINRLLIVLCFALAPAAALADADAIRDRVVQELHDEGFAEIQISRTFLGRMRFIAQNDESRREIVVTKKGVILRDYTQLTSGSGGSGSGSESGSGGSVGGGSGGSGDDNDDDDNDDDDNDSGDDDDDDDGDSDSGGDDGDDDDDGD